ncbi:MAG: ATP-binding cassette domain-containing protein [Pontiellaceae bacterium]|nr:ATP-binding cassette domain-containing protein [Pontiellaceae bacterium]MBN2785164.1 ATP-binding cassette domain-containing protein [Pontiellaceae bacterium]
MISTEINQFLERRAASCAILGTNGAGKSRLAAELAERSDIPTALVSLEQQLAVLEEERRNDDSDFMDCPDPGRSALEFIREGGAISSRLEAYFDEFRMGSILGRGLKYLSTGEFRKVQLCRALAVQPQRLILDEPFDGLDAASQAELKVVINQLAESIQLVLLLNRVDEIVEAMQTVFLIDGFGLVGRVERGDDLERFFKMDTLQETLPAPPEYERLMLPAQTPLIDLRQVRVAYGDSVIFSGLDWRVMPGEHWQVSGPNGCGKTTLLEMVTGDHPQLFANEVNVFGIRRGSGESVWDIKKHIGHVSSSVQLNYRVNTSVLHVVVSGFHDSIGVYRTPSPGELSCAREWLKLMHLAHKADRPLRSLSYGEQRMALIARAMVKRPALLVLDEPCQGLDEINRRMVLKLIDFIGHLSETTVLYVSHHATDQLSCVNRCLTMGA